MDNSKLTFVEIRTWKYDGVLLNSINDEPAYINDNGTEFWLKDGVQHRENGPAIMDKGKGNFWYLNGKMYSFEDFLEITPLSIEEKSLLKLKYF